MESNPLSDRVAIVTGGGRGLGRAMVLGLARAGARVVATAARERPEIEAVAEEACRERGKDCVVPLVADVTAEQDCRRTIETAIVRFGGLDILVNNAGRGMKYVSSSFLTEPTRFWTIEPGTWRTVIDTNVNGPFLMARSAVSVMLEAGWGRVVNIFDEPRDHAPTRLLALRPIQGGAGVGDHHLGSGAGGHGGDRERAAARRRDAYRHDPGRRAGQGALGSARSSRRGPAAALAGFATIRRGYWTTAGGDALAYGLRGPRGGRGGHRRRRLGTCVMAQTIPEQSWPVPSRRR